MIGPIDGDKLLKWLREYPKDLKNFNSVGMADLIETGRFSLSSHSPKSELKPDDIVGSCDCGKGYVSFKKLSPEVQRALNGKSDEKLETLKEWLRYREAGGQFGYGLEQAIGRREGIRDVIKKIAELEQEGTK